MDALAHIRGFDLSQLTRLLRKSFVDRAVLVLKILLGIGSCIVLSLLIKEVIATRAKLSSGILEIRNREIPPPLPKRQHQAGQRDFSELIKNQLISLVDPNQGKPAAPVKPVSTIPMGLIGVFIQDGAAPYAIIEDKKKSLQDVFMAQDMIFGEAKLVKILSDRVEIERNGQIEQLIMEDGPAKGGDKAGGAPISSEGNTFTIDEAEIDKALENLPLLLTQARAVPYFKDGVSVGLRLFAIKSDSMYEKLGLRNGDILKSVNGNSLGDLTQAMKLFETLKQERNIAVKIERAMEDKEFRYEIR
jgi:general secretion pathway protein C